MKVLVVGAGIVGVSTAWELSRRGVEVVVLERGEVSGGTTGLGEGNVLCSDKEGGPDLELARLGRDVYAEIEAELGAVARIRRKGALIVHPDARTWAAEPARVERLRAAGVEARLVEDPRALEPELTADLHGATVVPDDLQCDPRSITRALAERLDVRTGVEVHEVTGGSVRTDDGELRADAVVVAAGPWSAALVPGLPLEPRKGQLVRLRLPRPDPAFLRGKIVDASYLLAVAEAGPGRQVSTVTETTWDGHVLVGSSRERCGFDPAVDPELSARLQAEAARIVPALAELEPDDAWVGFRPWLPDGLPAIGRSADGVWVNTGHEGAGVGQGPISGRLLAQALCGERPAMDLEPFDPGRFNGR